MKLKKGDQVEIIAGKDRGRRGKLVRVFHKRDLVVVEGLNMAKKHKRARQGTQKGERVEIPMPMHASNVMLVCPHTGKPTRVGYAEEGGERVRVSKRSGKAID